jgi:hypothetical protein
MKEWFHELFFVQEAWLGFLRGGLIALIDAASHDWPTDSQGWTLLVAMFLLAAVRFDTPKRVAERKNGTNGV